MIPRLIAHLRPPLDGYENPLVVETIFRKTEAYRPTRTDASFIGAETVLDFGGGCGVHEKQAHISTTTRWAIVETPAMCDRMRWAATPTMQWFTSIDAASRWLGPIDLIHCNGALQYTSTPCNDLISLIKLGAKRILWRRMAFSGGRYPEHSTQTSYLWDNGPKANIPVPWLRVRYPITRLPKAYFMAAHSAYRLISCTATDFEFELKDPS